MAWNIDINAYHVKLLRIGAHDVIVKSKDKTQEANVLLNYE